MSKRIKIKLSDSVWELLQQLPKAERSSFVDEAVSTTFVLADRRAVVAKMDQFRRTTRPVSGCSEDWIREYRDSH